MKSRFYTLVAEQNAYIDSFFKVSDLKTIEFYQETMKSQAIQEVENEKNRFI